MAIDAPPATLDIMCRAVRTSPTGPCNRVTTDEGNLACAKSAVLCTLAREKDPNRHSCDVCVAALLPHDKDHVTRSTLYSFLLI